MPGAGARRLPGAHQRRARTRLRPPVHQRRLRPRRLLQGESHPRPVRSASFFSSFSFFFQPLPVAVFRLGSLRKREMFYRIFGFFFFKWLSTYYVSRWPPATHQVTSLLFTEFLLNFRVRVTEFSGPLSLVGFFFLEEGGRVGFQPTGCFRVPTIDTCSPSFHRFLLLRPITLVTRVLFFFCVFPHISFPVPLQLIDSIHRLFLLCSPTRTVWHFFLPSFLFFFTFFHYRNPF